MLHDILNKSWKQQPHKTGAIWPPASHLNNQERKTRHEGHCFRNKEEHIKNANLWTHQYWQTRMLPTHARHQIVD